MNFINNMFNQILAKVTTVLKSILLPFIRPIDTGSFGRMVCTFLLWICYYYSWKLSKDIPPTLLTVLEAMLLYVFGTKVYTGYTDLKKTKLTSTVASSKSVEADTTVADTDDSAAPSK